MRKTILSAGLAALCAVSITASAQDYSLNPIFEFINIQEPEEYPWLRAAEGTNWEHDGTNTQDFFSTLIRYDDTRLMLYILENGINEAEATDEQLAISAEFPDRSIIWVNPDTGAPMGVALDLDNTIIEDSEFYIQKVTGTHPDGPTSDRSWALLDAWPQIAVDGDGYLYMSDKHKILRFLPDGDGGFQEPTVVFTYPEQDPPVYGSSDALHYRAWIIRSLNVVGSGDNKIMTTAARFWIDNGGTLYYESTDGGATFEVTEYRGQDWDGGAREIGHGGATSAPVVNTELNEEWIFSNGFPGSNDRLFRFVRTAGTDEEFFQDAIELFNPTIDPADVPEIEKYMKWNMIDVAAMDGVPYIAVLTLPDWQSRNNPDTFEATAWVALHSVALDPNNDGIEGDFVSSYQIDSREIDELQGLADEDNWDAAYLATINMSMAPSGQVEILWSGGNNGFGRLVVGEVVSVKDWALF